MITRDNSSLSSMATDQLLDLFSLEEVAENLEDENPEKSGKSGKGIKALLENLPELWDDSQYSSEYDLESYGAHK